MTTRSAPSHSHQMARKSSLAPKTTLLGCGMQKTVSIGFILFQCAFADNRRPACADLNGATFGTETWIHCLTIYVPGFGECALLDDGWVRSSGNLLFWVPPDHRYGLRRRHLLLNMPTSSSFRATKLDFTNFHCGLSWTNVRNDIK